MSEEQKDEILDEKQAEVDDILNEDDEDDGDEDEDSEEDPEPDEDEE